MTPKERFQKEIQICERAEHLGITVGKRISYLLDVGYAIDAFHMDVDGWLEANNEEFAHDFIGICKHIDRESISEGHKAEPRCFGEFVPRFCRKGENHE